MNPIEALKRVRNEVGISSIFPITHFNTASVFETKAGLLGSVISVAGTSFITEEPHTLNALSHSLHQAILGLGEQFMCYVTVHRKKEKATLEGTFSSALAQRINDKYHARFKNKSLYKNHLYLTVLLKGDTSNWFAKGMGWMKRLADIGSSEAKALSRVEHLKTLTNATNQLMSSLKKFTPKLLGEQDEQLGYSELFEFLSLIPNGGDALQFQQPNHCPAIAHSIPQTFIDTALYPEGNLGQYLCSKQVLFGEYIQFQGAASADTRFAAMLSLKQYGRNSSSLLLDPLLSLDCEFITTHTFAAISLEAALRAIDLQRSKLISSADKGESQIEELKKLEDALARGLAQMGHHHNSLMMIAPSIKHLERAINQTVTIYSHVDAVVVKESPSLGAEPAFAAQIPGNQSYIARASLITSFNFVDFCSLHNYQTGFRDGNKLGEAVTLLETPSKTPVWFNYHGKGSKTNPSNGHTLVLGSSDAGKTTFVSFMDSQMGRYNGRSIFLDRDQASKIYILASGNSSYTVIAPENQHNIRMNPLQLPDTPENRTFVKTWFASLIKQSGEVDLPADIAGQINECINYNFDHLDKPYRRLSHLVKILPLDFPRWPELHQWLKGDDLRADGEYAWLFDNEEDVLELGFERVGFDITYLTDNVSTLISTPVYLYLLHRIHQSLDGQLTTINIDEAFAVFDSPFWIEALKKDIPTIRKMNGHFVFMTQSPQTIIDSVISPTILNNLMTMIIFPNSEACHTTYTRHLKLSETQYHMVKTSTPESRVFLYKQKNEVILCKLDLSALEEEIRILSGNKESVALMDALRAEVGDEPEQWLPLFLERSAA
ncbi:VirB4 family type IV secretion/conjugal transfer ATPase [Legionella lytica]|uniref:VirB4 family type IV secretion/conjugal transfer ATPase n=1 Tax=Legionella lytica TaxID=96232 RepID=A0ABW8DD34_9GAMM